MPRESIIFGIAGIFFGILVGWMLGSQHGRPPAPPVSQPTAAAGQTQAPARFDESRAAALKAAIEKNANDAPSRVQLGDLYFDAERFAEATEWYQAALKIDPKNVNASTDLGIAYYYMNQADRALEQFNRSLALDSRHTKTLLNIGIVRAFGKQDLEGAAQAWQRVIELAPDSPEAKMARQALEGLRSAHPAGSAGSTGGSPRK